MIALTLISVSSQKNGENSMCYNFFTSVYFYWKSEGKSSLYNTEPKAWEGNIDYRK